MNISNTNLKYKSIKISRVDRAKVKDAGVWQGFSFRELVGRLEATYDALELSIVKRPGSILIRTEKFKIKNNRLLTLTFLIAKNTNFTS